MRLIRETSYDVSSKVEGKNLHIEGIFIQADLKNGNGRLYPMPVLEGAVQKYRVEKIEKGCSTGELDHPDTPVVNLKNASHRIVSLTQDGANFIGKALVLNTFYGNQVRGMLEGGVTLAVSTRGLGSIVEENGLNIVQSDFTLCTVDIVSDPSAPNAFVNGILEGKEWICDNGIFRPKQIDSLRKTIKETKSPLQEKDVLKAFEKFMQGLGEAKY